MYQFVKTRLLIPFLAFPNKKKMIAKTNRVYRNQPSHEVAACLAAPSTAAPASSEEARRDVPNEKMSVILVKSAG